MVSVFSSKPCWNTILTKQPAPVHLSYYAAVALNFRALMSPVTKAAKQDPQSSLRRYFRSAIDDFRPFIDFMHSISPECMHAFWGLRKYTWLKLGRQLYPPQHID